MSSQYKAKAGDRSGGHARATAHTMANLQRNCDQFCCHFWGEQNVSPCFVILEFYQKFDAITDILAAEGINGWVAWTGQHNQPVDADHAISDDEGLEGKHTTLAFMISNAFCHLVHDTIVVRLTVRVDLD